MAYLTRTHQNQLDESQRTVRTNYILAEMNAGNTDGAVVIVNITGVYDGTGNLLNLSQRSWSSSDAATAFITFVNGLSPAPIYAQVVPPL
jgi:hypothetical protein